MNNYRFILEKYNGRKTRFTCPFCRKISCYTRYIDVMTGEYLPFEYGKCDRIAKCGYDFNPYKKGYVYNDWYDQICQENYLSTLIAKAKDREQAKLPSLIDYDIFRISLQRYGANNFVTFLASLFGSEIVSNLIDQYSIGTATHWTGSTVFWQKDINGNIRTGKIMLYNPNTGKRVKEPWNHITWAHKVLKLPGFNLRQCLFGEHLLKEDINKPVAIVESEKTAIICSVFHPEFIWLATGSLGNLSDSLCEVLNGREVRLFPDLGSFEIWSTKAKRLRKICNFQVSELLENDVENLNLDKGDDLADFFINNCKKKRLLQLKLQDTKFLSI